MIPEDAFKLTLEGQLKLRVINDEIRNCSDVKELQDQLFKCSELVMHYQTMLNVILKRTIDKDLNDLINEKKAKEG